MPFLSPLSFELARTHRVAHRELTADGFTALFQPVIDEASDFLVRAGVSRDDITVIRHLDMRYRGQGYEIDMDEYERRSQTEMLVIPSPARREDPTNWVHKTVPLKPVVLPRAVPAAVFV